MRYRRTIYVPETLSINYALGKPSETFFASTESESGPYKCCGIRSVNDIHTSVIKKYVYIINALLNLNGNTSVIDDANIFDVHTRIRHNRTFFIQRLSKTTVTQVTA